MERSLGVKMKSKWYKMTWTHEKRRTSRRIYGGSAAKKMKDSLSTFDAPVG